MNKKRNSPGWCEHPEEQISLTGFCEIPRISNDYNSGRGPVSRFLLPGRQNAITLKTLEKWTGMDERTIRRLISEERDRKIPIVADCQTGYFLAETELEKKTCVLSMLHRANEIRKTAEAIDRADLWRG